MFVIFGFWVWSKIEETSRYSLWVDINGELWKVPVPVSVLWKGVVLTVGLCFAIMALMIARLWWERRCFYQVIKKLGGDRAERGQN